MKPMKYAGTCKSRLSSIPVGLPGVSQLPKLIDYRFLTMSERYGIDGKLDSAISLYIRDLNRAGIYTFASCAGHVERSKRNKSFFQIKVGYVYLLSRSKEEAVELRRRLIGNGYGSLIRDTSYMVSDDWKRGGYAVVDYNIFYRAMTHVEDDHWGLVVEMFPQGSLPKGDLHVDQLNKFWQAQRIFFNALTCLLP